MGISLEITINALKDCKSIVGLRAQYDIAIAKHVGDSVAIMAIQDCTYFCKERIEKYIASEIEAGKDFSHDLAAREYTI